MGQAKSPDLLLKRWCSSCTGWATISYTPWPCLMQDGIPIYWDEQGRPSLPVIGRGWLLMVLGGTPTRWTEEKTIRTPRALLKNAQDPDHLSWGLQCITLWKTLHPHLPKWELWQPPSQRIQDLTLKQLALAQHTFSDWCFQQGGPPWGKTACHNDPWLSQVGLPQQVAAPGFWTTNTNIPQWPCKLSRFGNGTRACRHPSAPCLFLSVSNSGLTGWGPWIQLPWSTEHRATHHPKN